MGTVAAVGTAHLPGPAELRRFGAVPGFDAPATSSPRVVARGVAGKRPDPQAVQAVIVHTSASPNPPHQAERGRGRGSARTAPLSDETQPAGRSRGRRPERRS